MYYIKSWAITVFLIGLYSAMLRRLNKFGAFNVTT